MHQVRRQDQATAELTYSEVGASLRDLPAGYHHLEERRRLGTGAACFDEARDCLLGWEMQRRAGLTVPADGPVRSGQTVVMILAKGPVELPIPVRVVALIDEPDRTGFAYGTLPGHPELGEESFVVSRDASNEVWLEIRAFSRPGLWWMRIADPAARILQRRMTERYLRALRRPR